MRVHKETVTTFFCDVCGNEYDDKNLAKACDNRPIEERIFRKGDIVGILEKRTCVNGRTYQVKKAVVEKVLQPQCTDEEYEHKWLGGKKERLESHVRVYQVGWKCPRCREWQSGRFYTPELKLVSRKAKNKKRSR